METPETEITPEVSPEKVYEFGGHKFKMSPNTIGLLHLAAPVLIKYRKLEYQYTNDIDLSEVHKVNERLEELKDAIADLQEVPEDVRDIKRIEELRETLKAENEAFLNDTGLQNGIQLYNECIALAMYELITDMSLMRPLMNNILVGDIKAGMLDYTDPAIVDFIKNVIADFFFITKQSKSASQ